MRQPATVPTSEVTVAVLSGGAGTRLGGRDKGLELLRDRPLIAHVIERMRPQAGSIAVCANRNADDYVKYAPVWGDDGAPFRGPLAGITAALVNCSTPWLVTVPVDSPDPPDDLVARLSDAAARESANCVVVHDGERRQPLFALYSRRMSESARRALAENLAVWRWQETIGAVDADFSGVRDAFVNLNSADEFRQWERTHA